MEYRNLGTSGLRVPVLSFGTGTFGDMGCHIFDPVFAALALTAPVSVRSEGPSPNADSWANNALIRYVFPATRHTIPSRIPITWYDGNQRPPAEIRALLAGRDLPDQGSILIGTDGVMIIPHVAMPIVLKGGKVVTEGLPVVEGVDHWHQFIDAVRGEAKTSTPFSYSGPLTESILLGGVASFHPKTTLEWDSTAMRFPKHPEADKLVKRPYRKGWEVAGLG